VVVIRSRNSSASDAAVSWGCGERPQDRHRQPCLAARRVDGEIGGVAQPRDPIAVFVPLGQPLLPQFRLLGGVLLDAHALPARIVRIDPGQEVLGPKLGEGEQQVAEVALRVDDDGGNLVDRRLL